MNGAFTRFISKTSLMLLLLIVLPTITFIWKFPKIRTQNCILITSIFLWMKPITLNTSISLCNLVLFMYLEVHSCFKRHYSVLEGLEPFSESEEEKVEFNTGLQSLIQPTFIHQDSKGSYFVPETGQVTGNLTCFWNKVELIASVIRSLSCFVSGVL